MWTPLTVGAFVVVFVAALFIADAAATFWRQARGIDDDAVSRRLLQAQPNAVTSDHLDLLRDRQRATSLSDMLGPLYARYVKFVRQSHLNVTPERLIGFMALGSLVAFIGFFFLLPSAISWTAVLFAPIVGVSVPYMYVSSKRSALRQKFEEQLPDALDLIVRSLRIGHPVSSAIAVIAREMPAPIGPEFGIVAEQIAYGHELPTAIEEMQDRVPAPDLSYFAMAIQIQHEAGGNLVESLQKLANVIRDRYRMFRKVHAITAEGRFSAWALSLFPFGIAFAIMLVRPDYYNEVVKFYWFPYIAVAVVIMLIVNVVMMRILTTIKV
jgi:tight adherence protein B